MSALGTLMAAPNSGNLTCMPRTRQQIEAAAARTRDWIDSLDPAAIAAPNADATTLRAVAAATAKVGEAMTEQAAAVAAARRAGKSWSEIAHMLGTSRQAARVRFGEPTDSGASR